MDIKQERAKFELWLCSDESNLDIRPAILHKLGNGDYSMQSTFVAWAAWQASQISNSDGYAWKPLSDVEWMNIVNHDHAYESFDKESAVNEAVKRTEAKLKEINTAAPAPDGDRLDAVRFEAVGGVFFIDGNNYPQTTFCTTELNEGEILYVKRANKEDK